MQPRNVLFFYVLLLCMPLYANGKELFYTINEKYGTRSALSQRAAFAGLSTAEERYSIANSWEGMPSGALQSMLYFYRTARSSVHFSDAYEPYTLKPGDLLYYSQNGLHAEIQADGRIPYGKSAPYYANAQAYIAGRCAPTFSMGAIGHYTAASPIGHSGFNQEGQAGAWMYLDKGRYDARLSGTYNDIYSANGLPQTTEDYIRYRHHTVHFTQSYRLGPEPTLPYVRLIHTLKWEDIARSRVIETAGADDSISFRTVKHTLALEAHKGTGSPMPFSLNFYAEHDYRYHANLIDGTAATPATHDHHFFTGFTLYDQLTGKDGTRTFDYRVAGNLYVFDRETIEGSLSADFGHQPNTDEPMEIRWGIGGYRDSNTRFIGRYYGTLDEWQNHFATYHRIDGHASYSLPQRGLSLTLNSDNVHGLLYFDNDGRPAQHNGWIHVAAADLKADFQLHENIFWENQAIYQFSSNRTVMPLPDFSLYTNLYYEGLRKTKDDAQQQLTIGIDLRFYTAFFANEFDSYSGGFKTQQQHKTGNYPLVGVYVNYQSLTGITVFAAWRNIATDLFGTPYYSSPDNADPHGTVRIGLRYALNTANR